MRVLGIGNMYPPHHLGGYELMWQASTEALLAAGHSVRVLTTDYRRPGAAGRTDPDVHRELRWYWRDGTFPEISRVDTVRLEIHNRRRLREHLEDFRPDVVALWPMGGMSLSMVGQLRRARVPVVGLVHDDWMLYGPDVDRWTRGCLTHPRLGGLIGRLFGLEPAFRPAEAGVWVFNSDFVRRRAASARELPDAATDVVHPGVDSGVFSAAPRPEWMWRLLYVGRVDERKGIATAIDCLRRLPAEGTLKIVGGGDAGHLAALRRRAADQGLEERVEFTAQRPVAELAAVYADADVLVFPPTWDEPWGLVPMEAMAVGTPVVATGTGGSAEYLEDGVNCLLFEPGDADSLAMAVRRLSDDDELTSRLVQGGQATAARHTAERFTSQVTEALERAA